LCRLLRVGLGRSGFLGGRRFGRRQRHGRIRWRWRGRRRHRLFPVWRVHADARLVRRWHLWGFRCWRRLLRHRVIRLGLLSSVVGPEPHDGQRQAQGQGEDLMPQHFGLPPTVSSPPRGASPLMVGRFTRIDDRKNESKAGSSYRTERGHAVAVLTIGGTRSESLRTRTRADLAGDR
jgi:hypothetical protein